MRLQTVERSIGYAPPDDRRSIGYTPLDGKKVYLLSMFLHFRGNHPCAPSMGVIDRIRSNRLYDPSLRVIVCMLRLWGNRPYAPSVGVSDHVQGNRLCAPSMGVIDLMRSNRPYVE